MYGNRQVIKMQPDIDYTKIGQRIRTARQEQGLKQSELGAMVGCSNNHMSHIEIGQTKVSLTMLLRISLALGKNLDYFLMDTPFVSKDTIINSEIAEKLSKCKPATLVAINKISDIFLEQESGLL